MSSPSEFSPGAGTWFRVALSLGRVIVEIGFSALALFGFLFTGGRWRRQMGDRIRASATHAGISPRQSAGR